MALDIFMWLFAGSVAGFSIIFVLLIYFFVAPARSTIARDFIAAKRKGYAIALADTGSTYEPYPAKDTDSGYMVSDDDRVIIAPPNSVRMTKGNVKMVVCEYNTMKSASAYIADMVTELVKNGITPKEVKRAMKVVEDIQGGKYDARQEEIVRVERDNLQEPSGQ